MAIILGELVAESVLMKLESTSSVISANVLEARIVVEARCGPDATRDLGLLLKYGVGTIVPVDDVHGQVAFEAWQRFGKGRHPAQLNYGDCFAYATAKVKNLPLLFVGQDFVKTDLVEA